MTPEEIVDADDYTRYVIDRFKDDWLYAQDAE